MIPLCFCLLTLLPTIVRASDVVWLDDLNLAGATQDWGKIQSRKSVDGNTLSVGGRTFERGVGTHANASMTVVLDHDAEWFDAVVGVDDEKEKNGTVVFRVIADGT